MQPTTPEPSNPGVRRFGRSLAGTVDLPLIPRVYGVFRSLARRLQPGSVRHEIAFALPVLVLLPVILLDELLTWARNQRFERLDRIALRFGQMWIFVFSIYFVYAVIVALCSGAFERAVR
jgi:hypothetical protein